MSVRASRPSSPRSARRPRLLLAAGLGGYVTLVTADDRLLRGKGFRTLANR